MCTNVRNDEKTTEIEFLSDCKWKTNWVFQHLWNPDFKRNFIIPFWILEDDSLLEIIALQKSSQRGTRENSNMVSKTKKNRYEYLHEVKCENHQRSPNFACRCTFKVNTIIFIYRTPFPVLVTRIPLPPPSQPPPLYSPLKNTYLNL